MFFWQVIRIFDFLSLSNDSRYLQSEPLNYSTSSESSFSHPINSPLLLHMGLFITKCYKFPEPIKQHAGVNSFKQIQSAIAQHPSASLTSVETLYTRRDYKYINHTIDKWFPITIHRLSCTWYCCVTSTVRLTNGKLEASCVIQMWCAFQLNLTCDIRNFTLLQIFFSTIFFSWS